MKEYVFFYLMFLNIYYWEKLTLSKLVRKVNFLERKFEEMPWLWRAKRYKVYSGKFLFWHYYLQLWFIYKSMFQISLKFQKTETRFCRWKSTDNTLISSCHWKTLVPFCLPKNKPENAFLIRTVNYCKIVQKNKLCYSKQQ